MFDRYAKALDENEEKHAITTELTRSELKIVVEFLTNGCLPEESNADTVAVFAHIGISLRGMKVVKVKAPGTGEPLIKKDRSEQQQQQQSASQESLEHHQEGSHPHQYNSDQAHLPASDQIPSYPENMQQDQLANTCRKRSSEPSMEREEFDSKVPKLSETEPDTQSEPSSNYITHSAYDRPNLNPRAENYSQNPQQVENYPSHASNTEIISFESNKSDPSSIINPYNQTAVVVATETKHDDHSPTEFCPPLESAWPKEQEIHPPIKSKDKTTIINIKVEPQDVLNNSEEVVGEEIELFPADPATVEVAKNGHTDQFGVNDKEEDYESEVEGEEMKGAEDWVVD